MKAISIVMHSTAAAVALLVFAASAQADDFIAACGLGAPSGGDMAKKGLQATVLAQADCM